MSNAFSNRRGPSSYYSQYSNVSPILEEKERGSVKSYASSNVIPKNATDFYFDETPSDEEDASAQASDKYESPTTLVRQASLGRRQGKPALTSIKPRTKPDSPPEFPQDLLTTEHAKRTASEESLVKKAGPAAAAAVLAARRKSLNSRGSHLVMPYANPSSEAVYATELEDYLGELEKSSDEPTPNLRQVPKSMLSERVGARRPPDLDVERVRVQEARASLTSLPDLIRRATRLAANLDRGKTASRLGMDWAIRENGALDSSREKGQVQSQANRATSPTQSTPRTEWPSNRSGNPMLPLGSDGTNSPPRKKIRKRCCGMSRNSFLGLFLLLILLIAAAVVIPVALIVIPRSHNSSAKTTVDASCSNKVSCANGGTSMSLSGGSCACVCVNGFQGATCNTVSDAACTTAQVGSLNKATIGNDVIPLISSSNQFSIPLNGSTLLLEFARANLTCATENALVTFTKSNKRAVPFHRYHKRDKGASTTNGIVVAGSATPTPTPTAAGEEPTSTVTLVPSSTTSTGAQTSSSSQSLIPTGTNIPVANSTAQEFAKVGILFVLQDSQSLDATVNAQEKLTSFMNGVAQQGATRASASNVTLGDGYFINMWDWTVTLRNGTVYGAGFNGTATILSNPSAN